MNEFALIQDLFFVLVAAFIGGLAAKLLKLPLVFGYLLSGIVVGRISFLLFPRPDTITGIAQIGVALLLFTVGLEFTLQKLKDLGEVIVFGAFIQIVLTTLLSTILFPFFGFDFYSSLVFGTAFSLSSTAVAIKTLSDRGELETLNGEMVAGWSFMQDLYTVPLFMIIPVIGKLVLTGGTLTAASILTLLQTLIFACILFWIILFLGKKLIPFVMEKVAGLKSRELVTVAAVAVCFLFALLFQSLQFSFAVGAFVAGILIASSSARLGIFSEVRPLRDLFSVVFFVSLGFLLDPRFIMLHLGIVLALVAIVLFIKFVISMILIMMLGYHAKTAIIVSSSLLTVSEFAFIFALTLKSQNLINDFAYNTMLSVTLLSLLIGVFPSMVASNIYLFLKSGTHTFFPKFSSIFNGSDKKILPEQVLENHIIVLGYGRVGKYICRALSFVGARFVVVDFDHRIVKKLQSEGVPALYGDPADESVLETAGIKKAKAIIMAYPDRLLQEMLVTSIFNLNKDIYVLCRTHHEEDQKRLKALGVQTIVQPEFEASITLTEKILKLCNIEQSEIDGKIARLKIEHGSG